MDSRLGRAARAVAEVVERAGRLDVLVDDAGMMQEALADMSLADWERAVAGQPDDAVHADRRLAALSRRRRHDRQHRVDREVGLQIPDAACCIQGGASRPDPGGALDHGAEVLHCNAINSRWIDTDLNIKFIEGVPDPRGFRSRSARSMQ